MKAARLTQLELRAICEALGFRLADDFEDDDIDREVYESAHAKLTERVRWKDGESP